MKSIGNIKFKALLSRFLLCTYVAMVAFQFGLHEQIHHKHNDYEVQVVLKSEKFCKHETSLEHTTSHAHLDIAELHCDFCDQLFQQVLFPIAAFEWDATNPFLTNRFGSCNDQQTSSRLIISRNKSPPLSIS